MDAKGFITKERLWQLLPRALSYLRNANLAYRLVDTALKIKYGKDLSYRLMKRFSSLEQPEEYADVKSKAE